MKAFLLESGKYPNEQLTHAVILAESEEAAMEQLGAKGEPGKMSISEEAINTLGITQNDLLRGELHGEAFRLSECPIFKNHS